METITHAEIFPTMYCNLRCPYCIVPARKIIKDEQPIEKWIEYVDKLENIGVRFVLIMGGEPTVKKGIVELIAHLSQKKTMDYGLSTNGVISKKKLEGLIEAGLRNVIVSVDEIVTKPSKLQDCGSIKYKSYHALRLMERLRELGIENRVANFTINADNLDKVLSVYQHLSQRDIIMNLCVMQWLKYVKGKNPGGDTYEIDQKEIEKRFPGRLTEKHRPILKGIIDELIKIELENIKKGKGRTLANSYQYLKNLSTIGIDQKPRCNTPATIAVGYTGQIGYCPGQRGETWNKFHMDNFDLEQCRQYLEFWGEDALGSACPGCTFSFRDRTNDFDYLGKQKFRNIWCIDD